MRELLCSNGVAIIPDRGLGLYKDPSDGGIRHSRNTLIFHYETNERIMVEAANVADEVANEEFLCSRVGP